MIVSVDTYQWELVHPLWGWWCRWRRREDGR